MTEQKDTSSFQVVYHDITSRIDALAASLKVGATHVYEVLVRQQVVNSFIYLICFVLSLAFLYAMCKVAKSIENADTELAKVAISICAGLFGVILLVAGLVHIPEIIIGFTNPEYGAMKDIVDFIK